MQWLLTVGMDKAQKCDTVDCALDTCPCAVENWCVEGANQVSSASPETGQPPEDSGERSSEVGWKVYGHWRHRAQSKAQFPCMLAV